MGEINGRMFRMTKGSILSLFHALGRPRSQPVAAGEEEALLRTARAESTADYLQYLVFLLRTTGLRSSEDLEKRTILLP